MQFPLGFRFRDIQTTLEHEGEPVSLSIRRRDVPARQPLEQLFQSAVEALRELNPQLRVIRQRDCFLAGNPAKVVDFHFNAGHEPRHGRLVGALVPIAGSDSLQWLDISSVIDPSKPGLSQWLAEFDRMLDGFAQG